MIQKSKKRPRKKGRSRKSTGIFSLKKLIAFTLLFLMLVCSVCVVGYVIFFRTVFANESPPGLNDGIVYEEPNPPGRLDSLVTKEQKTEPDLQPVVEKDVAKKSDLPKVAIIIDDMGYDEVVGKQFLKLPFELTYSFLPFAPHTRKLENLAYLAGKTVFLHLPLQPKDITYNPGPGALYLHDPAEMQRAKLMRCLQEVPHAMGVNNHMGSLFTEDEPAMTNILSELKQRSLVFIDSFTSSSSVAWRVATAASMKTARRNVFLDNNQDEEQICHQLEKLVHIAESKGWSIGIGHPHQVTLDAIVTCGEKYRARIQYVGVRAVL